MVCVPVQKRAATDTHESYGLTDDPEDPVFYSSCFARSQPRVFIGYDIEEDGPVPKGEWQYGGKCLSCDNYANNHPNYAALWCFQTTKCSERQ